MFWKIFSGVWLCSWKYHRKHIFYFLFTFPHIFLAAKQIYNIIPQYRNTKETKPRKNIHQIRSYRETQKKKNPEKIFIKSDHTKKHKRNKTQKKKFIKSGQIKRRRKRDRRWCGSAIGARVDWRGAISVGVDLCLIGTGVGRHWCGAVRQTGGVWVGADLGSLSLSLSLSVCGSELGELLLRRVRVKELRWKMFEVKMRTEMVFRPTSLILRSTLKIFSVWPSFPNQPNSLFYGKAFLNLVWSQNKHSLSDKKFWGDWKVKGIK